MTTLADVAASFVAYKIEQAGKRINTLEAENTRLRTALAASEAKVEKAREALKAIQQDREYVMGWNAGFDHALTETVNMQFPTMLRKMWSGAEIDKWLSDRKAEARATLKEISQ